MHCTALVVAARSNLNHLETQRHCCMRRAQGVSKPNDARPLVRKPSPPWKIFHLAYFCLAGVTRLCGCCMVFYFEPRGFGPGRNDNLVYVGKDKFENEDLITHGLPTDIWFHVDDLSSAHVYLRLPPGQAFEAVPADTLEDCAQLVKANSIVGSKRSTVDVVYTPWSNLKKTAAMDVGQVSFHSAKLVKKMSVAKSNDIVNRLNRTKKELYPDLAAERQAYDRSISAQRKADVQAQKKAEKAAKVEAQERQDLRSYKGLMQESNMAQKNPQQTFQDYEEDFM